ncbi:MAG: hypothetical protein ACFCUR_12545 [Rhodomicrobiaceae bacterium]
MPDWFTYEFAKDFQSVGVGVGVAGFTGVIITLVVNAWLTRKQHERNVNHEHALVSRALLAELHRNRETFVDRLLH